MRKVLATSPDLKFIEKAINSYFYSKDYYIDDKLDLRVIYIRTIQHLYEIGQNELAEYFEGQISDENVFVVND